jgi:hypothetical protein
VKRVGLQEASCSKAKFWKYDFRVGIDRSSCCLFGNFDCNALLFKTRKLLD